MTLPHHINYFAVPVIKYHNKYKLDEKKAYLLLRLERDSLFSTVDIAEKTRSQEAV